jgi:alpha-ketoglutarate-dependent taurine dioxygenase
LASLPNKIVDRFQQRQVRYVRYYGSGLGLTWQDAFQTSERREVERHCRAESIEWTWLPNDALRTHQVRPAIRIHPTTGEKVWFNHAFFFNLASLPEETQRAVLSAVPMEQVPFNTFYGDGERIEEKVLELIRAAYDRNTVTFDWHAGDVLVLDNMLTAHGREPFAGARRVLTIMADPYRDLGH